VSDAGVAQWVADGAALCTAVNRQTCPTIVSDDAGGAVVTWEDHRTGVDASDIYAQRVSAAGVAQWGADGVALCTAANRQIGPAIVSDGAGGAIATWTDWRDDEAFTNLDVYAQRVQANGQLGGEAVSVPGEALVAIALDPISPNPTREGSLTVRFTLATAAAASLEMFDVAGRRIIRRDVGSLGAGHHSLDLGEGRRLAPGLYLVCLRQGMNMRATRAVVLE
jgi:hypothetical protein